MIGEAVREKDIGNAAVVVNRIPEWTFAQDGLPRLYSPTPRALSEKFSSL
jgi:hypothetical protein